MNERVAGRGFTLVELLGAVVVALVLLSFAGAITTEINQVVRRSAETSAANDYAAALERAMREDLSKLAGDQFMVIRQANVRMTAPNVRGASGNDSSLTFASDQLMFFAKGAFETGRLDPVTVVNSTRPNDSGDLVYASERPVELLNLEYEEPRGGDRRPASEREELSTSGAAARIWYGHLATREYRNWPDGVDDVNELPMARWAVGRHQLTLVSDEPFGMRDPTTLSVSPVDSAVLGHATDWLNDPETQEIVESYYAFVPRSGASFEDVGDVASVASGVGRAAWDADTRLPSVWNKEVIQGRVTLRRTDNAASFGGFSVPVDMAFGSLHEIRRFLRPGEFREPNASDAEIEAQSRFQFDLMRRACFAVDGTLGFDLSSRQLVFDEGSADFVALDAPIAEALRDESFGVPDEAYLLSKTMVPFVSSLRVEWAGDMDGDGLLDRFTESQNYRGAGSLLADSDGDGVDDYLDLNGNGSYEASVDALVGEPVWYGLDGVSVQESDLPQARMVRAGVANTEAKSLVSGSFANSASTFFHNVNSFVGFANDSNHTLGGHDLFSEVEDADASGIGVEAFFHDQVFGYPEEFENRWPRMIRVTLTQRTSDGRVVASNTSTNDRIARETLSGDQDAGLDLDVATTRFIIELPARSR